MYIIKNVLMWIAAIAGFVGIVGLIPFSIFGAVTISRISNEADISKKKLINKKGIFYIMLPWILIFGGVIMLTIIRIFYLSFE
jgi:hypothetical protein